MANDIVKFESATGGEISFTAQEVKERLCPNITDKELAFAMALCQAQRLNPFTKDVYIIKYGEKPAAIVTSKDVFTKRAQANPKFEGMEAGVTFLTPNGQIVQREGSMPIQGWQLIGGWCKVYVKGYRVPIYDEVALSEYSVPDQYGKNGWSRMPGTMIRKVALCHALREAFPDDFQGLYGEEEMGKAGEAVAEKENDRSESASEPLSGIQEPIDLADFVEMISDEQQGEIESLVIRFAEICGKETEKVEDALFDAKSVRESGVSVDASYCDMTRDQAAVAIGVLKSWIEKSEAAKEKAAQIEEASTVELADEDIPF